MKNLLESPNIPLAERVRPQNLDDLVGNKALFGKEGIIRKILEVGGFPSSIFWGPPGSGKTTVANIIANSIKRPFYQLSAINSGVKDIREVLQRKSGLFSPVLFIDEIHRFNKSQQDSLLGAVEKGDITLIGATTENPSFEINNALLSRCRVFTLESLGKEDLQLLIVKAMQEDEFIKSLKVEIKEYEALLKYSGGDARKLLNLLEFTCIAAYSKDKNSIDNQFVEEIIVSDPLRYDKDGETHYDIASALIKSIRGSDPNAAVYWLARMIEGGEDPKFIARRLIISAAEDIGLANPNALMFATETFKAVDVIGFPESRIILSECVLYLALSPKSNSAYLAIDKALEEVRNSNNLNVPLHLRNAPTKLMKDLGYGKSYIYPHDYEGNFKQQDYLPQEIKGKHFYETGKNPRENEYLEKLKAIWKGKYGY